MIVLSKARGCVAALAILINAAAAVACSNKSEPLLFVPITSSDDASADSGARDAVPSTADGARDSADARQQLASQCKPPAAWAATGTSTAVQGIDVAAKWVTISGNGRTAVWVTKSAGDGAISVAMADRADTNAAFANPVAVSAFNGILADDRIAVSGDGLRLIAVLTSRQALIALARSAVGSALAAAPSLVKDVNASEVPPEQGNPNPPMPREFFAPVLSADGQVLVYGNLADDSVGYGIWSAPFDAAFGYHIEGMLQSSYLRSSGTNRVRPTGLSGDSRALFYFDDATRSTSVTAREAALGVFANPAALPAGKTQVAPSQDCKSIYAVSGAAGATVAERITAP